ncbi:MAG: hypothetical protein H6855_01520 [Rhodospirillales bacterium]|nr:hypothetical protein [Rhodospirillales bacterium]
MNTNIIFPNSFDKLNLAKIYFNELQHIIMDYIKRKKIAFSFVEHPDQGTKDLIIELTNKPDAISVLIGDITYNLISALNYLMSELNPKLLNNDFPIAPFKSDLIKILNKKSYRINLDKWIRDFILNEIQPYSYGQGSNFWMLHNIGCIDRHRIIMPLGVLGQVAGEQITTSRKNTFAFNIQPAFFIQEKAPYRTFSIDEDVYIQREPFVNLHYFVFEPQIGIKENVEILRFFYTTIQTTENMIIELQKRYIHYNQISVVSH